MYSLGRLITNTQVYIEMLTVFLTSNVGKLNIGEERELLIKHKQRFSICIHFSMFSNLLHCFCGFNHFILNYSRT